MKYNIEKFIEFVADLVNEFDIFYERNIDSRHYFLHGGCYELYKVVKYYFPTIKCAIKKDLSHCVISYEDKMYDINGRIENTCEYRIVSEEDIIYMENRFGLNIDELKNENIIKELNKCRIKGILY